MRPTLERFYERAPLGSRDGRIHGFKRLLQGSIALGCSTSLGFGSRRRAAPPAVSVWVQGWGGQRGKFKRGGGGGGRLLSTCYWRADGCSPVSHDRLSTVTKRRQRRRRRRPPGQAARWRQKGMRSWTSALQRSWMSSMMSSRTTADWRPSGGVASPGPPARAHEQQVRHPRSTAGRTPTRTCLAMQMLRGAEAPRRIHCI